MIKIIEKEFLDDNFIIKRFASNKKKNENIYFKKDDTYYFGNYKKDKLNYLSFNALITFLRVSALIISISYLYLFLRLIASS
mgnify:CR=1 FL=1